MVDELTWDGGKDLFVKRFYTIEQYFQSLISILIEVYIYTPSYHITRLDAAVLTDAGTEDVRHHTARP